MNYKCQFCQRTFSRHSSYTRHVSKCILTVDSSNESNEDSNESKFPIISESNKDSNESKFLISNCIEDVQNVSKVFL